MNASAVFVVVLYEAAQVQRVVLPVRQRRRRRVAIARSVVRRRGDLPGERVPARRGTALVEPAGRDASRTPFRSSTRRAVSRS